MSNPKPKDRGTPRRTGDGGTRIQKKTLKPQTKNNQQRPA